MVLVNAAADLEKSCERIARPVRWHAYVKVAEGYIHHPNRYLGVNNDLHAATLVSFTQCDVDCSSSAHCAGFTFQSADAVPSLSSQHVFCFVKTATAYPRRCLMQEDPGTNCPGPGIYGCLFEPICWDRAGLAGVMLAGVLLMYCSLRTRTIHKFQTERLTHKAEMDLTNDEIAVKGLLQGTFRCWKTNIFAAKHEREELHRALVLVAENEQLAAENELQREEVYRALMLAAENEQRAAENEQQAASYRGLLSVRAAGNLSEKWKGIHDHAVKTDKLKEELLQEKMEEALHHAAKTKQLKDQFEQEKLEEASHHLAKTETLKEEFEREKMAESETAQLAVEKETKARLEKEMKARHEAAVLKADRLLQLLKSQEDENDLALVKQQQHQFEKVLEHAQQRLKGHTRAGERTDVAVLVVSLQHWKLSPLLPHVPTRLWDQIGDWHDAWEWSTHRHTQDAAAGSTAHRAVSSRWKLWAVSSGWKLCITHSCHNLSFLWRSFPTFFGVLVGVLLWVFNRPADSAIHKYVNGTSADPALHALAQPCMVVIHILKQAIEDAVAAEDYMGAAGLKKQLDTLQTGGGGNISQQTGGSSSYGSFISSYNSCSNFSISNNNSSNLKSAHGYWDWNFIESKLIVDVQDVETAAIVVVMLGAYLSSLFILSNFKAGGREVDVNVKAKSISQTLLVQNTSKQGCCWKWGDQRNISDFLEKCLVSTNVFIVVAGYSYLHCQPKFSLSNAAFTAIISMFCSFHTWSSINSNSNNYSDGQHGGHRYVVFKTMLQHCLLSKFTFSAHTSAAIIMLFSSIHLHQEHVICSTSLIPLANVSISITVCMLIFVAELSLWLIVNFNSAMHGQRRWGRFGNYYHTSGWGQLIFRWEKDHLPLHWTMKAFFDLITNSSFWLRVLPFSFDIYYALHGHTGYGDRVCYWNVLRLAAAIKRPSTPRVEFLTNVWSGGRLYLYHPLPT
jgi:hypothetical protein